MFGIDDAIEGVASSVLGPVISKLIDLIPDPTEKAKQAAIAQQALITLDQQIAQQQSSINQAEAASSHLFVAGWRPFIGWACGFAFAWQTIVAPLFDWLLLLLNVHAPVMTLDSSWITLLLIPMLGLGAAHTYERKNGVAPEQQGAQPLKG